MEVRVHRMRKEEEAFENNEAEVEGVCIVVQGQLASHA